jgi:4'-phosphopantetheinyl transferase
VSTALTPLPAGEVHVHHVLDADVTSPALLTAYEALLAPEERTRRDRYRFDHSKREYLLTRALVRTTLSRYADVAPRAWTFRQNSHGRPEIDPARHAAHTWLRFNLSNTRGLIACAVVRDREVGVDVEDPHRGSETVAIADRFFSPTEVAALHAQPREAQDARFFAYWTLKEAYIKARGLGLAIPLEQFSFLLDQGPRIGIAFDPRLEDDPAQWQFERLDLSPRHAAALAVHRGPAPDYRVEVRRVIPLTGT